MKWNSRDFYPRDEGGWTWTRKRSLWQWVIDFYLTCMHPRGRFVIDSFTEGRITQEDYLFEGWLLEIRDLTTSDYYLVRNYIRIFEAAYMNYAKAHPGVGLPDITFKIHYFRFGRERVVRVRKVCPDWYDTWSLFRF